jgi:DNA repair exonuclease SbcCD nuclease subunit
MFLLTGCSSFFSSGNYSIVVLPDTQKYSMKQPEIFDSQTQWIVDNVENENIKFVIHVGDIVEHAKSTKEWDNANKSLSILDDNNIPYSVVPGNHDRPTKNYNIYLPVSRFNDSKRWGGNYSGNDNNFQLLDVGKDKFIILSLNVCPKEDEIAWANSVFSEYPDRKGILSTHGYLGKKAKRHVHVCKNTTYIWDNMIRNHENLQIVVSGHVHAVEQRTDNNLQGKPVYQMLADYQNKMDGWLRILTFVPEEDKIYVKTYSPFKDEYLTDEKNEFVLDYEMG